MLLLSFVLLGVLFVLGLTSTIFKLPGKKFIPWFKFLLTKRFPEEETIKGPRELAIEKKVVSKPRDLNQLKMVFTTFDKNNDGFITKQELRESFEKIGIVMGEGEVAEMVEKSDVNGDGFIEFDEFCDLYESVSCGGGNLEQDEGELREAFNVFDGDKDGMISVEELGFMLRSLGIREGGRVEICKEMINKVDGDGDGMVSFDEFKIMMRSGDKFISPAKRKLHSSGTKREFIR